jgi:glycosyltransferase involved in cell wall biosynthesis
MLKKADVFKTVIPSKMLEFMACGRPVILGVNGQARQVLDKAKAGIFVEPEDPAALTQAVIHLYNDANLRKVLGHNGRHYILENLTRKQTAKMYMSVLEEVILKWKKKSR